MWWIHKEEWSKQPTKMPIIASVKFSEFTSAVLKMNSRLLLPALEFRWSHLIEIQWVRFDYYEWLQSSDSFVFARLAYSITQIIMVSRRRVACILEVKPLSYLIFWILIHFLRQFAFQVHLDSSQELWIMQIQRQLT